MNQINMLSLGAVTIYVYTQTYISYIHLYVVTMKVRYVYLVLEGLAGGGRGE